MLYLYCDVMKKKVKIILIVFLAMLLIPLGINFYVVLNTKDSIKDISEVSEKYDYILVLGCGVKEGRPSLMLQDRLDKALELYINGTSNKIILTGDEGNREVSVMTNYLVNNSVLKDDIIEDEKGYSTGDSMLNFKNRFKDNSVVIVTQEYHLPRSLYIAHKLKINALGVSAKNAKYYGNTYRYMREILARNKDFFKFLFQ